MPQVEDILAQVSQLDPESREAVFVALSHAHRETINYGNAGYASIVRTPGICGGDARLIRTRIPVWLLDRMRQLGTSEADILRSYPSLRAADLVQAWEYADRHRDEMEQAIRENEQE